MKVRQAINPLYWVNKVIDNRILKWKGVQQMEYNPLLTEMTHENTDKHMTRRILENSVWYSGIEQDLLYFYQTEAPKFWRKNQQSESLNYFWASKENDIRKIHTGIPQLLSEKMVDLIIGNGFEIKVEGKNEEEIQSDLDEALEDNKYIDLIGKSIETESWSGGVAWKLTYNPLISEYPIIEAWQPENYTNRVEAGRIVEDIFYQYYEKGNQQYRLAERYGVDDKGSYIDYSLEKLISKSIGTQEAHSVWIPCELNELEETKDLHRITFVGYRKRLSLYKPNKTPNSEFRYSILGESDYAGSYGLFDGLDEIKSTLLQELRDGKLNRYFPEELMLKNSSGNYSYPSEFKNKHILYADSPSENMDKQKIIYEQGDVRIEKHVEAWKVLLATAINNVGFSPLTIGVTGLEAIDASAESQQEREKVSIRTRQKKTSLWKQFLEDILQTYIEVRAITKNIKPNKSGIYYVGTLPDVNVLVTFEDYIIKSKRDRVNEVNEGFGVTYDILTGVQYVHTDKTEKEQYAISARIKLEQGINALTVAEASALENINTSDQEILEEDGVEIIQVNPNENRTVIEENDGTFDGGDQEE